MQSHASNDQLIRFRDNVPLDTAIKQHIEACSICIAELDELEALTLSLKTSEVPMLKSEEIDMSWGIIESSLNAKSKSITKPYWVAAAASMLIALLLMTQNFKTEIPAQQFVKQDSVNASNNNIEFQNSNKADDVQLNHLLAYSRLLENRLQSMPQPRVVRASTAGTIAQLEDQISMLDTRLSMQTQAPLSTQQRNVLWQQRVNSMSSLYQVRAAQLQRVSY